MILNKYPKIDLHGETTDTAVFIVNDFINDNYKMKNKYVVIIHGKGTGALRKKVHEILKTNKQVDHFELDGFNIGATLVTIKTSK